VRGAGGRHGERALRGVCVHRESQIRSGCAWARIGQWGDVARAQAEWAVRAGYGKRAGQLLEAGTAARASVGVEWAALGVRSGACGVFEAAQAGPQDDAARVPAGWAACTGYGGVDDTGVGVRCQRPSWTRSGTALRRKEVMEVLDGVDRAARACSAGTNLSNKNL
jgi:hypothetical protein